MNTCNRSGLFCLFIMLISLNAAGQVNPPAKKKALSNPLLLGQPATKNLSLMYEMHTNYSGPTRFPGSVNPGNSKTNSSPAHSIRFMYNRNVVMKPKLYMSVAAGYWFSSFNVTNAGNNSFAGVLAQSRFHSFNVSTNIFKPLNDKNFLLLNLSVEANGNGESFKNFSGDNLLLGGAAIYGWKKGVKRMWGIGFFRGYRLGRVIHVPALLYNNSFDKKWGLDALLPARANLRYRSSPKTQWFLGYELDGTQFAIQNSNPLYNNSFFQRGEIRPKIGWEQQLSKNCVFGLNAGLRINGRFDLTSDYAGKNRIAESNPNPAVFVNGSVHIVNLTQKKKKK